jgi:hypothetical protein
MTTNALEDLLRDVDDVGGFELDDLTDGLDRWPDPNLDFDDDN